MIISMGLPFRIYTNLHPLILSLDNHRGLVSWIKSYPMRKYLRLIYTNKYTGRHLDITALIGNPARVADQAGDAGLGDGGQGAGARGDGWQAYSCGFNEMQS